MTEEKENIWKKHCEDFPKIKTWSNEKQETAKKAYLVGYEQGYEDCRHYAHDYYKSKWHDLRKDPNDLPKYNEEDDEGNFYLVAFRDFYNQEKIVTREFIWNGEEFLEEDYSEIPYFRKDDNLIAWCELPEFEE